VLVAGLRRFAVIALVIVGVAVAAGLFGALLLHAGVARAVSVACYGLGGFMLVAGFFHGVRPPLRVDEEQGVPSAFGVLLTRGKLRNASIEERHDAISSSALFVVLGIILIVLGALIDPRHGVL
jgi:hypothetical protein